MDQIASNGVADTPTSTTVRLSRPDPLAGGIGTGSRGIAAAVAEPRHQKAGHHAGATAGAERTREQHLQGAPLRVLLTGGTGLIGKALAERLERYGHEVILGVRDEAEASRHQPGMRFVQFDFIRRPEASFAEFLADVDVVVNAVGIFDETSRQSFDEIHVKGPCILFELAARAGVSRIIQISALGADLHAETRYWRSKARGDRCAKAFAGTSVVVRPSLVYAPLGRSSQLFHRLAVLPWLPWPAATADVQPIHLDDLVDGVVALLKHPDPPPVIAAVGPLALSMSAYLRLLSPEPEKPLHMSRVPMRVALLLARCLQKWPGNSINADALRMLAHPNTADAAPWADLLGRPLRRPEHFVEPARRQQAYQLAVLSNMLPLLRLSVSLTWLVTAWVSAFAYPQAASIELLLRAQVPLPLAPLALYAAALLDAALALAMWIRRWRRGVYLLQIGLILVYSLIISLWLPEFWAHPYGPMIKNLPMLALTTLLLWLESPYGHRVR